MRWLSLLVFSSFLAAPTLCQAQEDTARLLMERGIELAAAGDTAAALAELDRAVDAAPRLAEAHYQLGRLLARHASSAETDFWERLQAEKALEKAIELDRSNPAYMAELGRLHVKQHMRIDGETILKRALKMAQDQGLEDDAVLADIHFSLGYIQEIRYERFRDRRIVPPLSGGLCTAITQPDLSPGRDCGVGQGMVPRYVEGYLEMAPPLEGSGRDTRERMLEYYRAALMYQPTHYEASTRLLVHLIEEDRLVEYISVARRLAQAYPDRPHTQLYLGLGFHAAGREDEAGAAFDGALAGLPEEDRAALLSLEPVMRRRRAEDYQRLDDEARNRFEDIFWQMTDPLYLTDSNERRLEHMARVAYADLRFAEPSKARRGWVTDRGIIFIRYGPADQIARIGNTIAWYYEDGPALMFQQTPGYIHTRFAGDYKWLADEYRYAQPALYDNIPSIPVLLPLPVQVARFRGESADQLAVEIHSELPLEDLAENQDLETGEIETGMFLIDARGRRILREAKTEVVEYADAASKNALRSWRLVLPEVGMLVAAVEARDAVSWHAAAARDTFTAALFPTDSLSISDILLADALRSLAPEPVRRTHFDIQPNPAREYAPNQPVVIYYELYGLDQDAEGFASYEVSLTVTVEALNREGTILGGENNPLQIIAVLADAWGFSAVGSDRLELRFSRELDMKDRDRATEFHSLDLRRAPAGEYEITLKIWDNLRQQLASRTRRFTVTRED